MLLATQNKEMTCVCFYIYRFDLETAASIYGVAYIH